MTTIQMIMINNRFQTPMGVQLLFKIIIYKPLISQEIQAYRYYLLKFLMIILNFKPTSNKNYYTFARKLRNNSLIQRMTIKLTIRTFLIYIIRRRSNMIQILDIQHLFSFVNIQLKDVLKLIICSKLTHNLISIQYNLPSPEYLLLLLKQTLKMRLWVTRMLFNMIYKIKLRSQMENSHNQEEHLSQMMVSLQIYATMRKLNRGIILQKLFRSVSLVILILLLSQIKKRQIFLYNAINDFVYFERQKIIINDVHIFTIYYFGKYCNIQQQELIEEIQKIFPYNTNQQYDFSASMRNILIELFQTVNCSKILSVLLITLNQINDKSEIFNVFLKELEKQKIFSQERLKQGATSPSTIKYHNHPSSVNRIIQGKQIQHLLIEASQSQSQSQASFNILLPSQLRNSGYSSYEQQAQSAKFQDE
ncbi:unnamed protein product (macronuclear) [Paramecium tetraurelia]|uniref:Transmembrane protein n=1 Tax=Paramecium tetraurelia TaxID=5888 RepID=A0CEL1_PARTE|nr:uncharacterized protein GSPATT00037666001 [Paramecium tetraurelia]CAK69228.1 unnamed protein product [Paramecium tetraurelia]|eukprot:XP_001436625.1 hypothetical protein (macronuclear) [Paramecium tetraurelia strain d4-2]